MKRIQSTDVTETLMKAMELADQMESVVVIYECKTEEGELHGGFLDNGVHIQKLNWMIDTFKHNLMSALEFTGEGE